VNPRRPAIFASAFAPHIGGVEELTRQLAREQQQRGLAPVVVTMRWPKTLPAEEMVDGIPVLRHVFRVPEPSPRFLGGWMARSHTTKRELAGQLIERRIDLVHVQCVSGNARYALAAARALGVRLVVSMQGELTMDATGIYQRSSQQRRAWRKLLDHADAITGCSQSVLDDARNAYGGPWTDRSIVIPNGVRVQEFASASAFSHPVPYLLGIGRMVHQKGFDVLLEAFAHCRSTVDHDLLLAGDGPERPALEELALRLGIAGRTRFLGSTNRATTAQLFRGASMFVLPSRMEPQGIVILEAMAAQTPVIASAVGGVAQIVSDRVNGLLVPAEDVRSLSNAITTLASTPEMVTRLVKAAVATAHDHDWTVITQRYLELYDHRRLA